MTDELRMIVGKNVDITEDEIQEKIRTEMEEQKKRDYYKKQSNIISK